jgi:hypothetical protein
MGVAAAEVVSLVTGDAMSCKSNYEEFKLPVGSLC